MRGYMCSVERFLAAMMGYEGPLAGPIPRPKPWAMRRTILLVTTVAVLGAAEPAPAMADRGALGVVGDMGADALDTLTAPVRWDGGDWGRLGLVAAGIAGAVCLDRPVQRFAMAHADGGAHTLATWANPLGTYGSFIVLGACGAGGWIGGDPRGVMVLRDGVIATVVASGIVTPALKVAVGRSRPNAGQGPNDLHPFSGGASFPSGHTTQAFAVASVIATDRKSVV